jgi:hypothetical protein
MIYKIAHITRRPLTAFVDGDRNIFRRAEIGAQCDCIIAVIALLAIASGRLTTKIRRT